MSVPPELPRRPIARHPLRLLGVLAAVVLALAAFVAARHAEDVRTAEAGERLFDGRTALVARIDGHVEPLPADAVACANCHRPRPAAGGGIAVMGPVLERALLVEPQPRRGGPPSRYDDETFCRLLQTGHDPAGVVLPRAMPRYVIDAAACHALWLHVTRPR